MSRLKFQIHVSSDYVYMNLRNKKPNTFSKKCTCGIKNWKINEQSRYFIKQQSIHKHENL